MSIRNREAGHSFERACAKKFREIGYTNVRCSRAVNRARDAKKVDLANEDEFSQGRFPFNVQCKNTTTLNYEAVLNEIEKVPGIINVILHNKTERVGKKFRVKGQYCFLKMQDFFNLVQTLKSLECKELQL